MGILAVRELKIRALMAVLMASVAAVEASAEIQSITGPIPVSPGSQVFGTAHV
jgi:hypothetical protein